jgi:copper transport protein
VYQQNCVGCHGVTGRGDGPAAQSLPGLPGDFTQAHFATHTDAELYEWIRGGKPGTAMPAFGEKLNDEQVWQVISYIRSIYQNAQTASR